MKRLLFIALSGLNCFIGNAQSKLPELLSDSPSVNIRINGDIVANWNIDPSTKPWAKPDLFTLDHSLHATRVTYISNRDSLSFMVMPGERYDFAIVIAQRGKFLMGLDTFPTPLFQCPTILISIFVLFILIAVLILFFRRQIVNRYFLWLGILSPLLFWVLTISGGFFHGNYNHLHLVVSELGAIGTKSEFYMSFGETLLGLLSALSVIGLVRGCRQVGLNVIPALTILSLSFSMVWAAIFPMHHDLHGAMGPIPLVLNAGVLLAFLLWRGAQFRGLRTLSAISFIFMMLILLRIIPSLRGQWEGLIQRFFYLGWTIWEIGLSIFLLRRGVLISGV